MLAWLSAWCEVQICILSSWYHCHSLFLSPVNPDWFYLSGTGARVVLGKGLLNGCCCCLRILFTVCVQICHCINIMILMLMKTEVVWNYQYTDFTGFHFKLNCCPIISCVAIQSIERKQVLEQTCRFSHLSVCLSVCLLVSLSIEWVNCGKRLIWSGCRLGWWVGSVEVWVY